MPGVIPAIVNRRAQQPETTRIVQEDPNHPSGSRERRSYGAADSPASANHPIARIQESDEEENEEYADYPIAMEEGALLEEGSDDGLGMALDVTWRHISRKYLLVPLITLIFLAGLILLITYAWPPNKHERKHGQTYPHAILWKPLLVGIFASCTIQTLRVPVWVIVSWFGIRPSINTYLSTVLHSVLHELARMATLPLSLPSPTSGFHSSYYLGIGWGIAEAVYGIVQGYEQLALYQDIMLPEDSEIEDLCKVESGRPASEHLSDATSIEEDRYLEDIARADEAELERKVEALERMRERRDLEEVIGVPFPSIPLALHLLWRLDTLLLNLGLTMILSAYYYDPIPIYRHPVDDSHHNPAMSPSRSPSPYLWLVWALVALVHVGVSVLWKVVGRVGVGAVTWAGLIVSLGSVFAGLGGWGGVV